MPRLFIDLETRAARSLPDVGVSRYWHDPHATVLMIGYAVDDGAVEACTPATESIPEAFRAAAHDPDWTVHSHNVAFDFTGYETDLVARRGYPPIDIKRWRCTLAQARAAALPGKLDRACRALGLTGKDPTGYRAAMKLAKPRRPRKGEAPDYIYWCEATPELIDQARTYLMGDVANCREVHRRTPQLTDHEQAVWLLDFEINRRGLPIDVGLATAAYQIVQAERAAINAELERITNGRVTSVHQVGKITELVRDRGHQLTSLGKRSVAAILARGHPDADIKRVLRLRQEGGKAAANKLKKLLASVDDDHRLRWAYIYHGAATGRFSSGGAQVQNLAKATLVDLDGVLDAIRSGNPERVRAYGPPIEVIGASSRALIRVAQ